MPLPRARPFSERSDRWASRLALVAGSPRKRNGSGDAEHALHSGGRVPGHRAEVRVAAGLGEGHGQLRRPARADDRGALAADREVMSDVADVLEDERDRAELRRLRRELEEELTALHLHGRGGLGLGLPCMWLCGGRWLGGSNRTECAVEPEQPEVVAVGCAGEGVAGGVEGDDLYAAPLEDGRDAVCAGAGLEAPEQVAVGGVVGLQLSLVSADEDEVSGRRDAP